MQKKIIALAIASALAAPAAFADTSNVTVYGTANMSYDLTNNGVIGTNKVSSNLSNIGLKGSEDLGDGLSAVWQIEQQINIDNSTTNANSFATRNSFLGLSSASIGTALLGRHDTPYKIATRGFDVFADSIADNRSLMGGAGLIASVTPLTPAAPLGNVLGAVSDIGAATSFDGRQGDVVAYISPAMGGFTGAIGYVAGAEGANAAGNTKGKAWSLAGLYGNGPLNVNLAYEVHDLGTAPGTLGGLATLNGLKESAWKIGAGYTMDAFTLNGVYEKTHDNFGNGLVALVPATAPFLAGTDILGHHTYYLSGKYSFGSDAVKLAYTRMGDRNMAGLVTSTGAKQWALGYDHNMSKRTTLYALYTRLNNDTNSNFGLSTAGTTGGMPAAAAAAGVVNKPSAWSFGMKHTF